MKKEHVKVISDNLCEEAIIILAFVSLAENGEETPHLPQKTRSRYVPENNRCERERHR